MRRFWVIALPVLVMAAVLYVIGSAGSARHAKPRSVNLLSPAPRAATTPAPPTTSTSTTTAAQPSAGQTTTPITAPRTNCRWRRYHDGAIGADPSCAPGELNPTAARNTAQTICSQAWVAAANSPQPSPTTLDRLLIEYQLPGPPYTYVVARVIPVQDGGSPTSPQNLYPLPLNGFGGQQTQTVVADQLHGEICTHKITVRQAAKTLEGDWLAKGLPEQ